jgi:EAL domain-containing protein (putative c-di-GMP-specific phosphodiesterase class I)
MTTLSPILGWRFFTPEMNGQALQRLSMETAIRQAIQKAQFFQVELPAGKIVGAEALLRWRHPEMGLVPPKTFIPIAENIGEIITIGEWVLRAACSRPLSSSAFAEKFRLRDSLLVA